MTTLDARYTISLQPGQPHPEIVASMLVDPGALLLLEDERAHYFLLAEAEALTDPNPTVIREFPIDQPRDYSLVYGEALTAMLAHAQDWIGIFDGGDD